MPVIEGADLTSVSTEREPLPEQEYLLTVKSAEWQDEKKKTQIIKFKVDEPADFAGREHWEYINIIQNDGKLNEISLAQIKRYMEAVFGKGSPESLASPPDTDLLVSHSMRQYLIIEEYERNDKTKGKKNKAKRIMKA
jgi:hypothetical protein